MKNQSIMVKGIREIVKLLLVAIYWAFPIATAYLFENPKLLFLFIVSGIETVFVYVHFEELEKLESCKVKTEE